MMNKSNIIKCPHCGYEYHVAEIFYPDEIVGKPENIVRFNTEIISFMDDSIKPTAYFTCDNCNKDFKVTTSIKYEVEKIEFEYETKIKSNKKTLEENY